VRVSNLAIWALGMLAGFVVLFLLIARIDR
jgi:hypothetical protein